MISPILPKFTKKLKKKFKTKITLSNLPTNTVNRQSRNRGRPMIRLGKAPRDWLKLVSSSRIWKHSSKTVYRRSTIVVLALCGKNTRIRGYSIDRLRKSR